MYTLVTLAKRDIENCTDCLEQDINLDGGAYAGLSFEVSTSDEWAFSLGLRQYVTGDLKNSIGIGFHHRP